MEIQKACLKEQVIKSEWETHAFEGSVVETCSVALSLG